MKRKKKLVVDASYQGKLLRIQKILARAGIASRRKAEELILQGRVKVNNVTIVELGSKANPAEDEVAFDGEAVHFPKFVYYLFNKPEGLKYGRPGPKEDISMTIWSLLPKNKALISAGRLDRQSEGLMIITNDGEFANIISHPSYKIEKKYEIIVRGRLSTEKIKKLEAGIWLDDGKMKLNKIKVKKRNPDSSVIELKLHNRPTEQIRSLFAKIGHPVSRLTRTGIGIFKINDIKRGQYYRLNLDEIAVFKKILQGKREQKKKLKACKSKPKAKKVSTENSTDARNHKTKSHKAKPSRDIEFTG